jgi:GDP-L-fucose synthase
MADGWLESAFSLAGKKIWIAGHRGMVGAALVRRLRSECCDLIFPEERFDLREQGLVQDFIHRNKPDVIVIAAARVGGIAANVTRPAEFLYDNLMIEANIIHAAHEAGVEKLLFLGSSCIYPKLAAQPIPEEALLTGALEPTNQAYALAKIAGVEMCGAYRKQYGRDFISVMPCNLYGPGDTYDLEASHVIPALLMKMHRAKIENAPQVCLWGSGAPLREFLHVDDLAEALVFCLENYSSEKPLNIGSGIEMSIADLAALIARIVGYKGVIAFDPVHPDGTLRKILDSSRLQSKGWAPKIALSDGLKMIYDDLVKAHPLFLMNT